MMAEPNEPPLLNKSLAIAGGLQPKGIWKRTPVNFGDPPAMILDTEQADPATFPKFCIWTGEPVTALRKMTIKSFVWGPTGPKSRKDIPKFHIELPVSEKAFQAKVRTRRLIRACWFAAAGLALGIGLIIGVVQEFLFGVQGGTSLYFCMSFGAAIIPLAAGILFPYMEDISVAPEVLQAERVGTKVTICGISEGFLKHLPSR